MANAKVKLGKKADKVILELTTEQAAAIRVLAALVDGNTSAGFLHPEDGREFTNRTDEVFFALDAVRDDADSGIGHPWPRLFEDLHKGYPKRLRVESRGD